MITTLDDLCAYLLPPDDHLQFQSLIIEEPCLILVQPGGKKNPFHVRPHWHIMVPYAQTTLSKE